MAKLLTGTRIYGTGTIDTQLFVSGNNAASSTITGALQVIGGAGVGGNLYVGGTIYGTIVGTITGTATTATQVNTALQTANASYYPTFVDANNASATGEALYTTGSFVINPSTGNVGIGGAPAASYKVQITNTLAGTQADKTIFNIADMYNAGANGQFFKIMGGASGINLLSGWGALNLGARTADGNDTFTSHLTIIGSGNVGIGTSSPAGKLEVAGDIYAGATTNTARFKSDGTSTYVDSIPALGSVIIRSGGSVERMRIDSSGNVGIGTTAPIARLNIATSETKAQNATVAVFATSTLGVNDFQLILSRGTNAYYALQAVEQGVAYRNLVLQFDGGSVGIGTTAPNTKLDVAGAKNVAAINITQTAPAVANAFDDYVAIDFRMYNEVFPAPQFTGNPSARISSYLESGSNIFGLDFWTRSGAGTFGKVMRLTGAGGLSFGATGTAYGTAGQILQSNGNTSPTWINASSIVATTAANIVGGLSGQLLYQSAPSTTAFVSTSTVGNVLVTKGTSAPVFQNTLTLSGTTISSNTITGAFQVVGGVGIGGNLNVGGNEIITGNAAINGGSLTTNVATFNLVNTTATTVNFAGAGTTISIGASTGNTTVKNNLVVVGNITVQGTTTIVDSTVTNISDPIITLGGNANNAAPTVDDNKDRGVAFKYYDGGIAKVGFFGFQDSTKFFTFFTSATITNEVVAPAGGTTKGALDAYLAGGSAQSIVYQSSPNVTAFLAASTAGHILQTNSTGSAPTWVSPSGLVAGTASQLSTIQQTASANYYPTFVPDNNAAAAAESFYTTSTFYVNPATGALYAGLITNRVDSRINIDKEIYYSMQRNIEEGSGTGLLLSSGTAPTAVVNTSATAPFGKVLSYSAYAEHILDEFIPVSPGEILYGEIWAFRANGATGTAGGFYAGVSQYDSGKLPVATNLGLSYFIASNVTVPTTGVWTKYSGTITLPTSHTVFGGSDGGPVRYVKPYLIINYTAGTIPTQFVGLIIRRTNLYRDSGNVAFNGGGNVGVGIAAPVARLQSSGAAQTTSPTLGAATGGALYLTNTDTAYGLLAGVSSSGNAWLQVQRTDASATVYNLTLQPSGGNVGIGTATPAVKLHLYNRADAGAAPSTPEIRIEHQDINAVGTGGSAGGLLSFYNLQQNNTGWAADSVWGRVDFHSSQPSSGSSEYKASMWAASDGAVGSTTRNTYLAFSTALLTAAPAERMRITSAGGIAFGGGTNYGSSGQILQSNGNASPTWVAPSGLVSGQVNTIRQTANASYYPTFVDTNNATALAESFYTTSTFSINPQSGLVSCGISIGDTTNAIALQSDYSLPLIVQRAAAQGKGAIVMRGSDTIGTAIEHGRSQVATDWGTYLAFLVHNDNTSDVLLSLKEKMRINGTGVGIGTTTPQYKLDVNNGVTGSSSFQASFGTNFSSGTWSGIHFGYSEAANQSYRKSAIVFERTDLTTANAQGKIHILNGPQTGSASATLADSKLTISENGNVGIGTTAPAYKLEVNGSFAAVTKSFVINHPTKPGMKLRYGSLEGPENGIYVRGKLTGSNKIELPEYWTKLVDPESITVSLTSIGKHQDLYVADIANNVVTVGNGNILSKAINCFYVVYGERADVDKLVVEI